MAAPTPLVVDLDGTLIRTDMLWETLWSALTRHALSAIPALFAITKGRAALKAALARLAAIDPAALPYNEDVLALIRERRAAGGEVILATATDRSVAEPIAAHLGLFDDVIASDGARNLRGAEKAQALVARYGAAGFDYAGDSRADLPVFAAAGRAITVDADESLRRRVTSAAGADHLGAPASQAAALLRAVRPHQWLKNLLVFLPLLTSHSFAPGQWAGALIAFVTFSMAASGVYLLNDLLDLSADRAHPRKRNRPLAAGRLRLAFGAIAAPTLIAAALLLAVILAPGAYALALVIYIALTTAYSFWLKRKLLIDICVLALLYALRVIAGGLAAGVWLSPWLIAFATFLFLSLAAVKRQAELESDKAEGRDASPGRAYVIGDLPIITGMALAAGYVGVLVMALYVTSPQVAALYAAPEWLWGVCPVLLYWVSRVVMLAHRGRMHDDPVVFAVTDRVSYACGAIIIALAAAGSLA